MFHLAGQLDHAKPRRIRLVVAKNVEWISTGMIPLFAQFDLAGMFVLFSDFVLVSAATEVFVEAFVGDNSISGLGFRHGVTL